MKFITPQKGWVVGEQGTVLYTEDGGENWEAQESGTKLHLRKVQFIDHKKGWMIGEGRSEVIILHTYDGGKNWSVQWRKEDEWMSLSGLHFINENGGWAAGNSTEYGGDCILINTFDGGTTWVEKEFKEIYFDKLLISLRKLRQKRFEGQVTTDFICIFTSRFYAGSG